MANQMLAVLVIELFVISTTSSSLICKHFCLKKESNNIILDKLNQVWNVQLKVNFLPADINVQISIQRHFVLWEDVDLPLI